MPSLKVADRKKHKKLSLRRKGHPFTWEIATRIHSKYRLINFYVWIYFPVKGLAKWGRYDDPAALIPWDPSKSNGWRSDPLTRTLSPPVPACPQPRSQVLALQEWGEDEDPCEPRIPSAWASLPRLPSGLWTPLPHPQTACDLGLLRNYIALLSTASHLWLLHPPSFQPSPKLEFSNRSLVSESGVSRSGAAHGSARQPRGRPV